jgi:hypothetical protein
MVGSKTHALKKEQNILAESVNNLRDIINEETVQKVKVFFEDGMSSQGLCPGNKDSMTVRTMC